MFSYFKKLFSKNKEIKPYSTTLTRVTEGVSELKSLSPEVDQILYKLKTEGNIDNESLNKVASFYFNTPNIPVSYFLQRKEMFDGVCFQINSVVSVNNPKGDVEDIKLVLTDAVYGSDLTMTISVQLFHEFFQSFQPDFDITKEP